MSFSDLPNEIIDKIFKYVAQYNHSVLGRKWDLASLSRCSQRLHSLVEPILYSSLEEGTRRSLLRYLPTIMERPDVVSNTKLYKGWHKPWTWTKHSVALYFSLRKVHKTFMQKVIQNTASNEQKGEDWFGAIMEGSWDATTALALTHLPRLQHLHLAIIGVHRADTIRQGITETGDYYWIMETLLRAAQLQHQQISSPQALEHLTTITLVPNRDYDRQLSMSQLMPFLKLKSVKKLTAKGWDLTSWDTDQDVKLATVELELQKFYIYPGLFNAFFACFPALEKLHYDHFDSAYQFEAHRPLMVNSLARGLSQARPPLKELYITDGSAIPFSHPLGDAVIESFSEFRDLEIIDTVAFDPWIHSYTIEKSNLVPLVDLLPSCIKQLTLHHGSRATIQHMRGLLERRDGVKDLKVLKIVFDEFFKIEEAEGEVAVLREEGGKCGVEIMVEERGFDEKDEVDL
jgi:hypothetical protein